MLDGMEEIILQVSRLILFIWFRCNGCFKDFPVIEYTYVACFELVVCMCLMRFDGFYGLLGNNVFRTFSNI